MNLHVYNLRCMVKVFQLNSLGNLICSVSFFCTISNLFSKLLILIDCLLMFKIPTAYSVASLPAMVQMYGHLPFHPHPYLSYGVFYQPKIDIIHRCILASVPQKFDVKIPNVVSLHLLHNIHSNIFFSPI